MLKKFRPRLDYGRSSVRFYYAKHLSALPLMMGISGWEEDTSFDETKAVEDVGLRAVLRKAREAGYSFTQPL